MVWDNIQKMAQARDQGSERGSKMYLWANAFAIRNRVATPVEEDHDGTLSARDDIPLSAYLPCSSDMQLIRDRAATLVSRIITKHVPYFYKHKDVVCWHIPHKYSEESALQSEVVSTLL